MVIIAMLIGFGVLLLAGFIFANRERASAQQPSQPVVTSMSSDDFVDFALDWMEANDAASKRGWSVR